MDIKKRFGAAASTGANVKRLLTTLANTKLAAGNKDSISWNSVYQTLFGLINNQGDFENETAATIKSIQTTIDGGGGSGGGGGGGGIIGASYITENGETAVLPNSKQLVAGDNITLTPIGVTLEISSTGGSSVDHVPMSTGAEPLEIMSNGAGEVLLIGFEE